MPKIEKGSLPKTQNRKQLDENVMSVDECIAFNSKYSKKHPEYKWNRS